MNQASAKHEMSRRHAIFFFFFFLGGGVTKSNTHLCASLLYLGKTSKFTGCSLHTQQPAAANLYRKSYTQQLNAAAFWLQRAVMNFDVFPLNDVIVLTTHSLT